MMVTRVMMTMTTTLMMHLWACGCWHVHVALLITQKVVETHTPTSQTLVILITVLLL